MFFAKRTVERPTGSLFYWSLFFYSLLPFYLEVSFDTPNIHWHMPYCLTLWPWTSWVFLSPCSEPPLLSGRE